MSQSFKSMLNDIPIHLLYSIHSKSINNPVHTQGKGLCGDVNTERWDHWTCLKGYQLHKVNENFHS